MINKVFKRKTLPTATVIEYRDKELDSDGNKVYAGIVKFKNDFGSICIMTVDQFHSLYEE